MHANVSVCRSEAGPDGNPWLIDNCNPTNMLFLMTSKKYNWCYMAEGNERTGNRKFSWPRGKTLGGSSAVNAMIYTRGHPEDYNHWARLGCEGWDFDSVLPLFKRSKRQARGEDAYHGVDGPMNVVDRTLPFPASRGFWWDGEEPVFPAIPDGKGGTMRGGTFFWITQTWGGVRDSGGPR